MTIDPRITKQRRELVLSQQFFGALVLRLNVIDDRSCETCWVDGVSLGYNPEYVATLNDLELRGVLAQKVLQVANGHAWRMGARDSRRWSDACAYAINPLVLSAGMQLPKGVLLDSCFLGQSAEGIYGRLTQENKEQVRQQSPQNGTPDCSGSSGGQGPQNPGQSDQPTKSGQSGSTGVPGASSPSCGDVRQYAGADQPTTEAQWKIAVIQAANAAQMYGKLPGDLQAMVGAAVRPAVDWRAVLQRFAQQSTPEDYSFAMPNRRYLHLGLYLPSLHSPAMADAVFVRDSSGSVFDETQAQFDAEILSVFYSLRPARLVVMDCDTRVTQVQIFERGDSPELLPVLGGGGTAFAAPFERVIADGIDPAFLVYLTDMDGRFPAAIPHYPVLWASTAPLARAKKAPFGECVEVIC
jgi:predicted metal-dependent peptidase